MAYIREYPLGILPGTTCILIFVERRWYIKNLEFSIALQTCRKLQLLTLLQRTLSLCVRVSKWGSVHAKRGELAVRLNKQTRFQYIRLLIIDLIPMYHTSYYVAILFSVPGHPQFNSLYRVKFKRRIRNSEARRPQTAFYFILVIFRTDLLSQGKIPVFFLIIYLPIQRGQEVRNRMCSPYGTSHGGGFLVRTPPEFKFPRPCLKLPTGRLRAPIQYFYLNYYFVLSNVICSILLASGGHGFGYTVSNMTSGNGMLGLLQV